MRNRLEFIFDAVAKNGNCTIKDIASLKRVLDSCQIHERSVLEVGCGIGDNLIYCLQKGANYAEGFDISGESIRLARFKTKGLSNVVFTKNSIEGYVTQRKFDFVIAWGVFEYLDDPFESLKKICRFLTDGGTMILLVSKPIFLKRISFLVRMVLSRFPARMVPPAATLLSGILGIFRPVFKKRLYMGESATYTTRQTVLEGLMVPRYNIFPYQAFSGYLQKRGFTIEFFDGVSPSMVCMVAKNG